MALTLHEALVGTDEARQHPSGTMRTGEARMCISRHRLIRYLRERFTVIMTCPMTAIILNPAPPSAHGRCLAAAAWEASPGMENYDVGGAGPCIHGATGIALMEKAFLC